MTEKSSTSVFTPQRCQHRTLKGRCRQLATDSAGTLCFDNARADCADHAAPSAPAGA